MTGLQPSFPAAAPQVENHRALPSVFGFNEWLTWSLKARVFNQERIAPKRYWAISGDIFWWSQLEGACASGI